MSNSCPHWEAIEAGFDNDGSPVYRCTSCDARWNDPAATEHWAD